MAKEKAIYISKIDGWHTASTKEYIQERHGEYIDSIVLKQCH
jgi:hypothetical protein